MQNLPTISDLRAKAWKEIGSSKNFSLRCEGEQAHRKDVGSMKLYLVCTLMRTDLKKEKTDKR
jgi:hypothetical protein